MTDKDIVQLFEKLKDEKQLRRPFDADRSWNLIASRCGFDAETKSAKYGFRDHVEYYVWQMTHVAVKPLVASFAVFLLLLTGWIGATNASFDSLPGDRLYPVKLSMEQAQLALAFDPDQHARLQLEFTSRRLEEMITLTAESNLANPVRVRLAAERFKSEVSQLTDELAADNSATLAKAVGRKAQAYRNAVASSGTDLPAEVAEQVKQVKEFIEQTQEQAVNVIITAHEAEQDEDTARELRNTFDKQHASIDADGNEEVAQKLEIAQALADEGVYRRAFQMLKEAELVLKEKVTSD